ncbi:MAG: hypothetical protein ABIQ88_09490 [Chitinophagaceae bacterium]
MVQNIVNTTQALAFTFNQKHLNKLFPAADDIVISICNIPEEGKSEIYLCAQAYKDNLPVTTLDAAVGCPSPPPWKDNTLTVNNDSLKFAPKFSINAKSLKASLEKNDYFLDEDPLVDVELAGRIIDANTEGTGDETAMPAKKLEMFISIKIQKGRLTRSTQKTSTEVPLQTLGSISAEAF